MTHTPAVDSLEHATQEHAWVAWATSAQAANVSDETYHRACFNAGWEARPAGGSERLRDWKLEQTSWDGDDLRLTSPDGGSLILTSDARPMAAFLLRQLAIAALASPQGAEQRQELSRRNVESILAEVLDKHGEPLSFGAFEEIVDRIATPHPASAATQGDAVQHIEALRALRSMFGEDRIPPPCHERDAIDAAIAALSSPPGVQAAQVSDADVERAMSAHNEHWTQSMRECPSCKGSGIVGVGDSQDYCDCGGGYICDATEESAMRAALESIAHPSGAAHGGEDEYSRGFRDGYERRHIEVLGALA